MGSDTLWKTLLEHQSELNKHQTQDEILQNQINDLKNRVENINRKLVELEVTIDSQSESSA